MQRIDVNLASRTVNHAMRGIAGTKQRLHCGKPVTLDHLQRRIATGIGDELRRGVALILTGNHQYIPLVE